MASVDKYEISAVVNQLRHNERSVRTPSNKDIDKERTALNYILSPDRGMTSYDYFKQRKSELYCYNRRDVKVLAGWVVTAPKDLAVSLQKDFFQESYNFLEERYHKENVVSAAVHMDESGMPHLHFYFIPAVEDLKHGGEKICANDVLNPKELRNFHPDLQRYLKKQGIDAKVINGATAGGNRTVKELKQEREILRQRDHERKLVF